MNFESLVGHINQVQDVLQAQAAHAVNLSLTARNWLVGYYIVEYEQHGEDRAKYGDKLLKNLARRLNRRGLGERRLYEYRLTYQVYPQLSGIVAEYVVKNGQDEILRLTTAKSEDSTVLIEKLRSSTAISVVPQEAWQTPAKCYGADRHTQQLSDLLILFNFLGLKLGTIYLLTPKVYSSLLSTVNFWAFAL